VKVRGICLLFFFPRKIILLLQILLDGSSFYRKVVAVYSGVKIRDNKLNSMMTWGDEDGNIIEYPSLTTFDNNSFDYFIARINQTQSPLLLAHYSNVLWLSTRKHNKFADTAIKNYLILAKFYENSDIDNNRIGYGYYYQSSVRNAYFISKSSRLLKIQDICSELVHGITDYNPQSTFKNSLRLNLTNLLISEWKNLRRITEIDLVIKANENTAYELYDNSDFENAVDFFKTLLKLSAKINSSRIEYQKKLAACYENLITIRKDDSNMISMDYCKSAIEVYKDLKDEQKIDELKQLLKKLIDEMKLGEISSEFDITEQIKEFRKVADNLCEENPVKILNTIRHDKSIIPSYAFLKEQTEKSKKSDPLRFIVSTNVFDNRGHVTQIFSTEEELFFHGMLQSMNFYLKLYNYHLIREIFFHAIKCKKLNASILLQYLNMTSWFGKNRSKSMPGGDDYNYNWLNLLAPSIIEYFSQIEVYFYNPKRYPNLVLCIDSLTMKFEGLIRDLCELLGIPTFYTEKDSLKQNISKEKDINALLREKKFVEFIDQDDLFFLKYLLVERAGYNLRNDIAHSFTIFEEYSIEKIHLLIIALIKLGKYDFRAESK